MNGQDELMEQKLRCVDLLLGCPLNRNAPDCPFRKMRQEEAVVTRVQWLKNLDSDRITQLLTRHETCLAQSITGVTP